MKGSSWVSWTRRVSWRAPALLLAGLGVVLSFGCAYDTSFKSVRFDGVERGPLFEVCESVIVQQYRGVKIRVDEEEGRIETDEVEFGIGEGVRRERAYLVLEEEGPGRFLVEVMAPISELVIDPSADNPRQWRLKGSDVTQEHRILDLILGEVLRRYPDAGVEQD